MANWPKKRRASRPTKSAAERPKEIKLVGKRRGASTRRKKQMAKPFLDWNVNVPGMVVAVIARPPVFAPNSELQCGESQRIPGVQRVVEIERGVAVVARRFWPAKHGAKRWRLSGMKAPRIPRQPRQREQYAELAANRVP